uniref:Protein YIPF n=1 Tax=Megafenestra aurita TaxID=2291010 RepID=A0A4Y7NJX8_9CRUS|nr:EOG090X0CJ3 [Megafenestra aurita]SVE92625.1 EOG090X0CJ3 [Megafenestra aurita]
MPDFGVNSAPVAQSAAGKPPPYEQTHQFSNYPTSHVDIDEDTSPEDSRASTNTQEGGPSMLSFSYYQQYFDVDTPQVKERLIWSFVPRPSKDTLTHYIRPIPDLYGPFWICVTLVFCIAIMGNIADYLHSGGEGQHWRYDFRKVSISASTIFCYALLLPLVLWVLLWWRRKEGEQTPLGFIEIVSLYGYSLAIYIPISILWTIPFPFVQWTLVIVGATLSGSVLVFSLWPPLSSSQKGMAVAILGAVLAFHFLLAAGLQLYFFRYANNVSAVTVRVHPENFLAISSSSVDKVTELQPLNLVQELQDEHMSTNLAADATKPSVVLSTNDKAKRKTESTAPKIPKLEPAPTNASKVVATSHGKESGKHVPKNSTTAVFGTEVERKIVEVVTTGN